MVRSFVALLAVAGASAQTQLAFLGSGGCDGEDVGCVGGGDAEHTIQAVEISRDGGMVPRPDLAIPTGGQPVWLTKFRPSRAKTCMFVTRADLDDVQSYTFDASGQATVVGAYKSGGVAPVHADVLYAHQYDNSPGNVLLVANYHGPDDATTSDGAAASSMLINEDCSLTLADVKNHSGSSVDPSRQGGAHVHSFTTAPYGHHTNEAYACDLGQDKIFSYSVDADGKLTLSSTIDTTPGSGPRHLAHSRSRTGHYVYVVEEMAEAVVAYEQTECDGAACLKELQTVSLVAEGQSGEGSKAAEIVMAPDGKTLYATNRGALNTVTVLGVESDGTMTIKQQIDAPAYPRGMTLAFNGGLLLVAGQSKTELASFQVKPDGTLEPASSITEGLPPHPAAFFMLESSSVLV